MRSNAKLETEIFRKESNNDIYLQWKKDTLKSLIRRAYTACLNEIFLRKNYTIRKSAPLRSIITRNGYRKKHLIILKPPTKTITTRSTITATRIGI